MSLTFKLIQTCTAQGGVSASLVSDLAQAKADRVRAESIRQASKRLGFSTCETVEGEEGEKAKIVWSHDYEGLKGHGKSMNLAAYRVILSALAGLTEEGKIARDELMGAKNVSKGKKCYEATTASERASAQAKCYKSSVSQALSSSTASATVGKFDKAILGWLANPASGRAALVEAIGERAGKLAEKEGITAVKVSEAMATLSLEIATVKA